MSSRPKISASDEDRSDCTVYDGSTSSDGPVVVWVKALLEVPTAVRSDRAGEASTVASGASTILLHSICMRLQREHGCPGRWYKSHLNYEPWISISQLSWI